MSLPSNHIYPNLIYPLYLPHLIYPHIDHMVYINFDLLIDVMGMPSMYTINQGRESIFMKKVLLLLGIAFSVSSVYAVENVLQTIEIEPIKDTYNIVLSTDSAVDVRKTVQAPNKITLDLKDVRASKNLNTVYNNVSNVDTVLVEPKGNGLSIYFQADNAAASTITFDTPIAVASTIKPQAETKNIKLSNPIESYAPIYKEDLGKTKTSNLFDRLKSSSSVANLKDSIDDEPSGDGINKFVSFGLLTLLAVAVTRLFKRKEPEMKIGLSQSLNDKEVSFYNGAQPFQRPVAEEVPFTTVNYGLNAYKNENRNPYETTPAQLHNPRLRNYVSQQQVPQETVTQTISRPVSQTVTALQTAAKKMTTPVNTAPVNQSNPNVDNLKFLESMTAIYEKSGRHDLARGLKASLGKNLK